jgi:uncharacterized protein (TIGR02284 family)
MTFVGQRRTAGDSHDQQASRCAANRSAHVSSDATCLAVLRDLIDTLRDGERGFALAVRDNREPGVESALVNGEEWCRAAAIELQDQMRSLHEETLPSDAAKPATYRGWISFKAVPIARGTKLILEECERGGDYALGRYEAAREAPLPEPLRTLIERQHQRLVGFQTRLRLLRNRYPATDIPQARDYRSFQS